MGRKKDSGGAEPREEVRRDRGALDEVKGRPSDSIALVGETAASEALTNHKPIGPSEAESRNALGMSPAEPERHRHASRKKPR